MNTHDTPVVLHERVTFGEYGSHGDAHVIINEGSKEVYFGLSGPGGGVSVCVTANLSVKDTEAFIALMQKAVDAVKSLAPADAGTDETEVA